MRAASLLVLLGLGGVWGWCEGPVPPGKERTAPQLTSTAPQLTSLVAKLGSRRFADRQAATRALSELGQAALESLRQAAHGGDPEVRRRADDLVRQIEKRLEDEVLLAPKRVHIVYKDKPIADAVADFARTTGMNMQLSAAAKAQLSNKRITLDTGDTTFWQAYGQLCAKAGLSEAPPKRPEQPSNPYYGNRVVFYGGNQQQPTPGAITLEVSKGRWPAVCYAGAVRVRALPPDVPLIGHARGEDETLIGLDVYPQPGLHWEGIVSMRVVRAIDDSGLRLLQPSVYVGDAAQDNNMFGGMVFFADGSMQGPTVKDPTQVPVHLRLKSRRSKFLKELTGIVSVQVQTPPMPIITVPDILKQSGATEHVGPDRHVLKLQDVKKLANGQIQLRVQLETPQRNQFGGMVMASGIGGGGGANGLSLKDGQGRDFRLVRVDNQSWSSNGWTISQQVTITFAANKNQGPAARLVYTDTRTAVVDVPFTLRHVALP